MNALVMNYVARNISDLITIAIAAITILIGYNNNFRLCRKAALGAIWDLPPVTSSINVGVRHPRWSHAGANLPLCLNVLLDTCVKYSEFKRSRRSPHLGDIHETCAWILEPRTLNLSTSYMRLSGIYTVLVKYVITCYSRARREVSPYCKLLLECRRQ